MSTLQLALLAIGAIVIIGVVVYNKRIERQAERASNAAFGEASDGLVVTSPREGPATRIEPALVPSPDAVLETDTALEVPPPVGNDAVVFDDETELIISLSFDHPIDGEKLAEAASGLRIVGTKPVQVACTHVQTDRLEAPRAGESFSGLHCGVLLANRQGPINAVEFSEFVAGVQRIAGALDLEFDVPDMTEALEQARALDARCAQLDAQINVYVITNGAPWSGTLVAQAAVEAGFAQLSDGQFAYFRRNGAELFSIRVLDPQGRPLAVGVGADQLVCSALNCVLDIPRSPEVEKPLSTMINISRALAARLGGSVVDDKRRPVTDAALIDIETQLRPMYERLRAAGFEPGSPRALLLFNQA